MQLSDSIIQRTISALKQPWWKPADPVLMSMLSEKSDVQNRRIVRWGLWAAVVSYLCYALLDLYLLPDMSQKLVLTRLSIAVVFLALLEFAERKDCSLKALHLVAALAIVFGGVGWLVVALPTAYQLSLSQFMVFGTIFVLGANLFFNFRFWLSAVASAVVTVAFVWASVALIDVEVSVRVVLAAFFINCLVFSLYLSWRMSRERYMTFLHELQAEFQEQVAEEKTEQLRKIASTDTLTGLLNRRAISQEFLHLSKKGLGENEQIGIILLDVDYFKRFIEKLGQNAADESLIRIAQAFSEIAKASNATVGRYGNEAFIVLVKVNNEEGLRLLSKQLCEAVEHLQIAHPDRGDDMKIVTVSAGATMTQNDSSIDLTLLLQQADRALYASKFGERGKYSVFDPHSVGPDPSGENLSELLKQAVSRRRVSLVYQPIFDCRNGQLVGHEALMRLRDFDGSPVNPAVFIPVAEKTGAIVELGQWAIEQACFDMKDGELGSVVSVNVSAVQLKAPGFALHVAESIARHGFPASRLALEVTEGIDILIETQAQKNIDQLHSLGVQVWLDDFGTGFAGLAWLRQFDFDVVKIDRAFLHDCQTTQGLNLLQDMVRLLRNLGLLVLVEGVETQEQKDLLRKLGVNTMQGFFLGRPAPFDEIVAGKLAAVR